VTWSISAKVFDFRSFSILFAAARMVKMFLCRPAILGLVIFGLFLEGFRSDAKIAR